MCAYNAQFIEIYPEIYIQMTGASVVRALNNQCAYLRICIVVIQYYLDFLIHEKVITSIRHCV